MQAEGFACYDEIEQLKALWHTAFPNDDAEDVDAFFDMFFDEQTCLVFRDDKQVVSMLFLLNTAAVIGEQRYPLGYIYAGATASAARGKGYYRRLLSFAKEEAQRRGFAALLLRPATDDLAKSYERMGFTVPLFGAVYSALDERDITQGRHLSAREFVLHRRRILKQKRQPFVDWDERVIAYAFRWCCAVEFSSMTCALCTADEGALSVLDLVSDDCVFYDSIGTLPLSTLAALICPIDPELPQTLWNGVYFGYGLD